MTAIDGICRDLDKRTPVAPADVREILNVLAAAQVAREGADQHARAATAERDILEARCLMLTRARDRACKMNCGLMSELKLAKYWGRKLVADRQFLRGLLEAAQRYALGMLEMAEGNPPELTAARDLRVREYPDG